jgi:hypothetical protein
MDKQMGVMSKYTLFFADAPCGSSSNIDIHRRLEKEEQNISDTFSSSEGCK